MVEGCGVVEKERTGRRHREKKNYEEGVGEGEEGIQNRKRSSILFLFSLD
jgi:hypothetical protein